MIRDGLIWVANNEKGEPVCMLPKMANRHGLVAGATGTGKTVTLKVMAEAFSSMGVPVFMADVKGDIASIMKPGAATEDMYHRIQRFSLAEYRFRYTGFPVALWDLFGQKGMPLRTTISEMGPLLLARILQLNDLQSDILKVVFKIADDHNLLLIDTKDLKAILAYVEENAAELAADYGKISSASVGVIIRAIVGLEAEGGDLFFGEPALDIHDWLVTDENGRGTVNVLDSSILISNGRLYSTFLLWLMSELFETLPEVGDLDKPKLVFFFDEAHLLFHDAPKVLLEKIEQMVKLIRSKGVGVYFCTQNPRDIPDGVLAQLGNKVEHGLRAYTPADQKAVKAAAASFRVNPEMDTYATILELGTGEAVVSFLDAKGIPGMAQKAYILPPQSFMGTATDEERGEKLQSNPLLEKYAESVDSDSAYEFLQRKGLEEQEEDQEEEAPRNTGKTAAKKTAKKKSSAAGRAVKNAGRSAAGTVGRQLGRQLGKGLGSFGKTLGGNVGASLSRGLFSTLFKR